MDKTTNKPPVTVIGMVAYLHSLTAQEKTPTGQRAEGEAQNSLRRQS